ncbi:BZ3500_MvSof-1268-A1-R1_Chr6-2g08535 [Microbotryum saponariae]|uniref:BZ3500_MvSof-1268-A1-R1_Chr6-2g08535 protein n=1 Tax=Microbotryum saponariae TaxID=289078 RepID=A0A2X0NIN8_9BASI|nr:BZ3500_MvSof-1268-A1-R1_Chr6-2g08535 [Microbotryum saponariae]SDA07812.1 BZ3501_MvSof-1269-A2-R1_Chr6-1g08249 [Microbotryum saponariae]
MSRYGGPPANSYGQPQQRSSVVFVGNLPFDYTEEQLIETFSSVGPVVSFRLVFDRDSGKPKGFGFCEYKDPETAASALRNLQGVEVGGRGLRLDFADTEDAPPSKRGPGAGPPRYGSAAGGGGGAHGGPPGAPSYGGPAPTPAYDQAPRPLPTGVPLAPGQTASDNITNTLGTMPPGQLLDIMSQMKNPPRLPLFIGSQAMVTASPYEARTLLTTNPQLSYALFQGMLLMNLVDPAVLNKMLPQAAPAPAPTPYGGPPQAAGYGAPPQSGYGGATPLPSGYGAPANPPYGDNGYSQPPPKAAQAGYGSAPYSYGAPQQAPPAAPAAAPRIDPQQAALIQQVMAMTQEQIDMLPAENRNTIMQIVSFGLKVTS